MNKTKLWSAIAVVAFSAAIMGVLMFVTFKTTADIEEAADQIGAGQQAIVCILAIAPDERRPGDVNACLEAAGLRVDP